ncbi:MAG: hypothetical protein ACOY46_07070 [Bacillota bacterium]
MSYLLSIKSVIFLCMLAVHILNVIHPSQPVGQVVNFMTIIAVFASIPFLGRNSRLVSLLLFAAGAYLLHISGAGWVLWVEAMGKNTSLLMLLISVPLLGVPLRHGGYISTLDSLADKYMRGKRRMYLVPAIFSHVLGVFMNIGAVTLTYQITARGRVSEYPGILARSISRGFGSALFWSPNMVATALVLGYMKVPWESYVVLGIAFAAVSLVAGYAAELFVKGESLIMNARNVEGCVSSSKDKLIQLLIAGFVFLSFVIFIETRTDISVINIIPIIALVFPVLWLSLLGKVSSIKEGYRDYFKSRVNRYDGEVVLFVVAGFFSTALGLSGWAAKICSYLMHFSGQSMVSVAFTILLTVVITSIAGIHPMISVSAFATSLDTAAMGLNQVYLALVLIAGWSLGATVSPMSGTNLVVGSLTGKTPLEVAFGNITHAVMVTASIILFLAVG